MEGRVEVLHEGVWGKSLGYGVHFGGVLREGSTVVTHTLSLSLPRNGMWR